MTILKRHDSYTLTVLSGVNPHSPWDRCESPFKRPTTSGSVPLRPIGSTLPSADIKTSVTLSNQYDSLLKESGFDLAVEASYFAYGCSFKFSESRQFSESSASTFLQFTATKDFGWWEVDADLSVQSDAISLFDKPPQYEQRYGTHYVNSVRRIASISLIYSLRTSARTSMQRQVGALSAQAYGNSLNAGFSDFVSAAGGSKNVQFDIATRGCSARQDIAPILKDPYDAGATYDAIVGFLASMSEGPAEFGEFELTHWSKLPGAPAGVSLNRLVKSDIVATALSALWRIQSESKYIRTLLDPTLEGSLVLPELHGTLETSLKVRVAARRVIIKALKEYWATPTEENESALEDEVDKQRAPSFPKPPLPSAPHADIVGKVADANNDANIGRCTFSASITSEYLDPTTVKTFIRAENYQGGPVARMEETPVQVHQVAPGSWGTYTPVTGQINRGQRMYMYLEAEDVFGSKSATEVFRHNHGNGETIGNGAHAMAELLRRSAVVTADISFVIRRRAGIRAEGTLTWAAKKLDSPAVSGPFDRGALPLGRYLLWRDKMLDKSQTDQHGAYCDSTGKCWMQPMDPETQNGRTQLGIHPDGNDTGTQGCIGLSIKDTSAWYSAFLQVPRGTFTTLEVTEASPDVDSHATAG